MYQCSRKLVTCKEHCCFDHFDFVAHSMFTSNVCWGSLGTSIFVNSSSAESNTRSRLRSRLSFRFLWLWYHLHIFFIYIINYLMLEQLLFLVLPWKVQQILDLMEIPLQHCRFVGKFHPQINKWKMNILGKQ